MRSILHQCESGGSLDLERLLTLELFYDPSVDAVSTQCPVCHDGLSFQLRSKCVTFGYVYAAGGPHFEGIEDHSVRGLAVVRIADDLQVSYGKKVILIKGPTQSQQWFFVRGDYFAVDKTLASLALDEFGVSVSKIQQRFDSASPTPTEVAPHPDYIVGACDRLFLAGPRAGVRKAMDRLVRGR